jgi:integrase
VRKVSKSSRKRWLGGYVHHGRGGPVFVIERWAGGARHHVSTGCRTERAALAELERFERDPSEYRANRAGGDALCITAELVAKYRAWMRAKGDTSDWIREVTRHLAHWAEDLGGRDIRRVKAAELRDALDARRTSRRHRIEALKGFCGWLRVDRELLNVSEDPTLSLRVPPAEPAKNKRRRAVPMAYVHLVLPHLPPAAQDVLRLLSGTAWHVSEVRRFAKVGEVVRPAGGEVLAVLVTPHKSGDLTQTPITTREHLAAAERIRRFGSIPTRETLVNQMRRACDAARAAQRAAGAPEDQLMPHWRLGVMRHSVLTHAVEQGASPREAAEFAGHRSDRTTRRFYVDLAVPTVRVPVLRLLERE